MKSVLNPASPGITLNRTNGLSFPSENLAIFLQNVTEVAFDTLHGNQLAVIAVIVHQDL